jgi:hypothetical protein
MPEIISRKEARAQGLKRYFTGKPCHLGHLEERTCVSGRCLACARLLMNERYKRSPEPYRQRVAKYRAQNSDLILARRNSPEAVLYRRCYRQKNFKKKLADAEYYQRVGKSKRKEHYRLDPKFRKYVIDHCLKYQKDGPINPKGEKQWLRKHQAILRSLNRILRDPAAGLPSGLLKEFQI